MLDQTLSEIDIRDSPNKIWNLDKKSVSLDPSKTKVVGGIGLPCSRTTYGSGKENITVLTAVNADGKKLTPLVVFKGKHIWDQWMADKKDDFDFDISYAASKRGWMESQIFYNYMKDIFIPSFGDERPLLLIYDGHSTHVDVNVVELAIKNDVTILKLPPHTSHLLQPLDLAVFKSVKISWNAKLVRWQRENVGRKLQKKEFAEMFAEIWHNCSRQIIINGFKKVGIHPFNRIVIPVDKYDPNTYKRWFEHNSNPKSLNTLCVNALNKLLERSFSTREPQIPEKEAESEITENSETKTKSKKENNISKIWNKKESVNLKKDIKQEKQPSQIEILSNVVVKPARSASFEELLLQKLQQSKRDNTNYKKIRVTSGAEVITRATADKILLEKKNKITTKKPKKNAIGTITNDENVDLKAHVMNVDNFQRTNENYIDNPVPGPSGVSNIKSKKNILTERKTNIVSTHKGKEIGKSLALVKNKET